MGETDVHRDQMIDLIEALKFHYRGQTDVYVSGNILMYYEEGNPQAHLSPDVLVTPGLSNQPREIYKLWEEGKAPELILEITSKSTRLRDVGLKKGLYEAIGVQEYLLFDPRAEYLQPRFQAFRQEGGFYVSCLAPEAAGYQSRLGLTFKVLEGVLRIVDSESGQLVPNPAELARLAEHHAARADAENQRAQSESQRADAESQRAELALQEAQKQRQNAERLARKLQGLGIDPSSP